MKSEERHKLHQNTLAEWLAKTITDYKPYQNVILGVVILVILALIVAGWWNSQSTAETENAWSQLFAATYTQNPSELIKVAQDYSRTKAAPTAALVAANFQLAQGCELLFINKAGANQELNAAVDLFQAVIDQASSPNLRIQAMFGLARARESQGNLDKAADLYSELIAKWPDSVFAQISSRRLADLKRPSIKEMYDKFAQYDPKPAFTKQPTDKSELDKLPDESPIFKLGAPSDQKPEDNTSNKTDETKTGQTPEKPADAQQTPGAEKPAK